MQSLKRVFCQEFPEYEAPYDSLVLLLKDPASSQVYELESVKDVIEHSLIELRRPRITSATAGSSSEHQHPQSSHLNSCMSFERKKLVLIMVGLPARGKTYIARKIARYLNWLNVPTKVFNVGSYRRERIGAQLPHTFYDPGNNEAALARTHMAIAAMDDMILWLHNCGKVAVFDATNTTRERRQILLNRLKPEGFSTIFIESICDDPAVVATNVSEVKTSSPDYVGVDPEAAIRDFMARIEHYKAAYQPLDDDGLKYIKVFDVGRKVVANRINSYLGGRILFYLLNLHTEPRKIYLTRHGQSTFNLDQRIGGDPELTPSGELYAHRLAQWITKNVATDKFFTVWTSTLRRSIATGKYVPAPKVSLRALDEIDAGICDGLTYDEVEIKFPDEFTHRSNNKLGYRYPRGESYIDVIQRLEPVIFELERQRNPVLVIGHQAVLRCLFAYFLEKDASDCPYLPIPLHTVIEIEPKAYGCVERQYPLVSKQELLHANRLLDSPQTPPSSPILAVSDTLLTIDGEYTPSSEIESIHPQDLMIIKN
ncbi:MAG: 6-phosphofructo-2-kinase/fructose-2,6-bisphosphatase [archaeon]|nr:6-phosphofructo-2-kinase/fructose-2,6-bisphosphatase [archaeon]